MYTTTLTTFTAAINDWAFKCHHYVQRCSTPTNMFRDVKSYLNRLNVFWVRNKVMAPSRKWRAIGCYFFKLISERFWVKHNHIWSGAQWIFCENVVIREYLWIKTVPLTIGIDRYYYIGSQWILSNENFTSGHCTNLLLPLVSEEIGTLPILNIAWLFKHKVLLPR